MALVSVGCCPARYARARRITNSPLGFADEYAGLADFARKQAPNAVVITFSQFLNDPIFDRLVQALKSGDEIVEAR